MINLDRKLPDVCSPPPPCVKPDCRVPQPHPFNLQEFIAQHPAEAMITVAGVGAGIAAIASGAPILVIVGVGIGIGLATKYALTLAKHTLPPM